MLVDNAPAAIQPYEHSGTSTDGNAVEATVYAQAETQ
jgi:hypothetical protein